MYITVGTSSSDSPIRCQITKWFKTRAWRSAPICKCRSCCCIMLYMDEYKWTSRRDSFETDCKFHMWKVVPLRKFHICLCIVIVMLLSWHICLLEATHFARAVRKRFSNRKSARKGSDCSWRTHQQWNIKWTFLLFRRGSQSWEHGSVCKVVFSCNQRP